MFVACLVEEPLSSSSVKSIQPPGCCFAEADVFAFGDGRTLREADPVVVAALLSRESKSDRTVSLPGCGAIGRIYNFKNCNAAMTFLFWEREVVSFVLLSSF